ncbi:MAG: hypothetical protein M1339_02340 [Bacteroidetes bacterium]|nr:hypothetical protein [Bacteroidota bacterium]
MLAISYYLWKLDDFSTRFDQPGKLSLIYFNTLPADFIMAQKALDGLNPEKVGDSR